MNVVFRSLRSIANSINPEGLDPESPSFVKIDKIQMIKKYDESQVEHIYQHDILNDDSISSRNKNRYVHTYNEIFDNGTATL